jgi:hypothetical protein
MLSPHTQHRRVFFKCIITKRVFSKKAWFILHIQYVKKLCTWMSHMWTCTWFRKNTNYLMKYAHINLLEVEKWSQLIQENWKTMRILTHVTKHLKWLLAHLMNNHLKYISGQNLHNTHLTQTFQWCN